MEKCLYHRKDIRHEIKLKDNKIYTRLEVRKGWFWRLLAHRYEIDFELRPHSELNILQKPMVLRYETGGSTEIWTEGTLDLNMRLKEIYDQYVELLEISNRLSSELAKQIIQ